MLLQPSLLDPASLLLSWVLCEQSLRLLCRPWRRGEDRAEGSSPFECSDSRAPGTGPVDAQLHLPGSAPCQPAPTALSLGDSGSTSLEE